MSRTNLPKSNSNFTRQATRYRRSREPTWRWMRTTASIHCGTSNMMPDWMLHSSVERVQIFSSWYDSPTHRHTRHTERYGHAVGLSSKLEWYVIAQAAMLDLRFSLSISPRFLCYEIVSRLNIVCLESQLLRSYVSSQLPPRMALDGRSQ